jgi:hypothetical protein
MRNILMIPALRVSARDQFESTPLLVVDGHSSATCDINILGVEVGGTLGTILEHTQNGLHNEARQLIGQLPASIRPVVQTFSDAIAKVNPLALAGGAVGVGAIAAAASQLWGRPAAGSVLPKPGDIKDLPNVAAMLAGAAGKACGSGILPWLWQSTSPVGTGAQTKRVKVDDLMLKADVSWFGSDNTFPLPFQSSCLYGFISSKGAVATKENIAQLASHYIEMSIANVIAQYDLLSMGVRMVGEDVVTTSGGGYRQFVDRPNPVVWSQYFTPKAQYYWKLYSNVTFTPVAAYDIFLAMPGAVVNSADGG